jgi:hypothetical protein
MSQDQRPARVRVVASNIPAATPQRRRSDQKPVPFVVPGPGSSAPSKARRSGLLRTVLFVIGCASGGILATAYDLQKLVGL